MKQERRAERGLIDFGQNTPPSDAASPLLSERQMSHKSGAAPEPFSWIMTSIRRRVDDMADTAKLTLEYIGRPNQDRFDGEKGEKMVTLVAGRRYQVEMAGPRASDTTA
ncbi:MAG TPA: hypothetical protein VD833_06265 [Vicinamibacterales bacterium]|nr:hypothetical protein [Vicinamibacterales bacterium]